MSAEDGGQQLSVACLCDPERGEECRTPSCHSRTHVRDVLTERGVITLCRYCRKQYRRTTS